MLDFILKITNRLFLIFIEFLSLHFRNWKKPNFKNTRNKSLLVIRHGGIGDLLFITPILQEIKNRYPELKITLMTKIMYHSLLHNFPYIDRLINHAWPNIFSLMTHDYIVFLDKTVEIDEEAKTKNIYDLFSEKYFGVKLSDFNKKPVIVVEQDSVDYITRSVPFLWESLYITIGIQIKAGSPVRTPSPDFWERLIINLKNSIPNTKFYLLINKEEKAFGEKIKRNIVSKRPDMESDIINFGFYSRSIQDLIAIVKTLDLIIAPDSSVIHISAAVDTPSIGIYGPFPAEIRIKYYPKAIGINAIEDCAPCFTHGHKPCKKAKKKGLYWSPCFNKIRIESVVNNAISLIKKYRQEKVYKLYDDKLPLQKSETSKFRNHIIRIVNNLYKNLSFLNGIEIGCGGDPLLKESICVDLIHPYTKCGTQPIHLKGDGRILYWFKDKSLDYIYSSHLFEDFDAGENLEVLREWIRVLKEGGILILLLPDQQRYSMYCKKRNEKTNEHHKIDNFSPKYMEDLVGRLTNVRIIKIVKFWEEFSDSDEYNFLFIVKKVS